MNFCHVSIVASKQTILQRVQMNLYRQFSISKPDSWSQLAFLHTSSVSTRVVSFGFGGEWLTQTLWVGIKTPNLYKSILRSVPSLIHKKRTCQPGSMRRTDDSLIHLLSSTVCGQMKTLSAISNTDIFCEQAETSTDRPHGGKFLLKSPPCLGAPYVQPVYISHRDHRVLKALKTSCLNGQIVSERTVNRLF